MVRNPFNYEERAIIRNLDLVIRAESILKDGLGMDLAKKWRQCVRRRGKELGLRETGSNDDEDAPWESDTWTIYPIDFEWQGHSSGDGWLPTMSTMSNAQELLGGEPNSLEIVIDLKQFSINMRRRRAELREFVESLSLKPNPIYYNGITLKWDEKEGTPGQRIFRYDTSWEFRLSVGGWHAEQAAVVARSRTGGKLADACPVFDAALVEYKQYCSRFRQMRQRIFSWKEEG